MFRDRREAGEALAERLRGLKNPDNVVYALPRGGVPVAAVVAAQLEAPLDLILVRKLSAPGHSEFAIGAVVDGAAPTLILHTEAVRDVGADDAYIERAKAESLAEIERRRAVFFGAGRPLSPKGRIAILVDDGLATGATMEAAVEAMRRAGARRVIVAAPVAPPDAASRFRALADDFICLETPSPFRSVGSQYESFPQLTDEDVVKTLKAFGPPPLAPPSGHDGRPPFQRTA